MQVTFNNVEFFPPKSKINNKSIDPSKLIEQSYYHHDFEMILGNGKKVKIGGCIDELMHKNKDQIIYNRGSEYLSVEGLEIMGYNHSTNEPDIIEIQGVSRHKTSKEFVKVKFSNGRTILVAPEHPILIWDSKIRTVRADTLTTDNYVLGTTHYPTIEKNNVTTDMAKFLGFVLSEGYTYINKNNGVYEIGFTNTDTKIIKEFKAILSRMNVKCSTSIRDKDGCKTLYTVRITSKAFYYKIKRRYPELFLREEGKSPQRVRRVPLKILMASSEVKKDCLNTYFKGDGLVDKYRIGYITSSLHMAEDLQDILLMLGIYSYMFTEVRDDGTYYKIIISGLESMKKFAEIVSDDWRIHKMERLIKNSEGKKRDHDVFPLDIIKRVKWILKVLHIDDGKLNKNIKNGYNAHRQTLLSYIDSAEKRLLEIKKAQENKDISKLKEIVMIKELSEVLNIAYSTLSYQLKQGDEKIINKMVEITEERIRLVEIHIDLIKQIMNGNVRFLKVKNIELVENSDQQQFYGIIMKPHFFISNGLILHANRQL